MGNLRAWASKLYLTVYNAAMCAGWVAIAVKIVRHLLRGGSLATIYPLIAQLLCIFQTGAVAEVGHAMLGLVRSPVLTTLLQVLSRLLVLYGVLRIGDTPARRNPALAQMVLAWALSETIRYAYYLANLYQVKLPPLIWLRYSAFMALYPIGIAGEIASIYRALPWIGKHRPWSIELPNAANFTFSWYNFLWFTLLAVYPYGSYVMYSYMLAQRRKTLGKTATNNKLRA